MLSYIFIKQESLHILPKFVDELIIDHNADPRLNEVMTIIANGLSILKSPEKSHPVSEIGLVVTGIASKELINKIYNLKEFKQERQELILSSMQDSPYGIIFFELPNDDINLLQEIKGKIETAESSVGTGLRGLFRRIYGGAPQNIAENFIHIPDTQAEMDIVFDYLTSKGLEEGSVLYVSDELKQRLEVVKELKVAR